MKRTVVIGYGNPLRGDDGVAWKVIEHLTPLVEELPVELIKEHQLTPEMAESIHNADLVVFVDASVEGRPGTWRSEALRLTKSHQAPPLGHHFDIEGLLSYCKAVYNHCPNTVVVSIVAESFDFKEQLSPSIDKILPHITRYIFDMLNKVIMKGPGE